jgi:hypothetical protein
LRRGCAQERSRRGEPTKQFFHRHHPFKFSHLGISPRLSSQGTIAGGG